MPKALTPRQKEVLGRYEKSLQHACRTSDLKRAEEAIKTIQSAFLSDRSHFRVLRAKNWYYEALLDSGRTNEALTGFEAIRQRANEGTRLYLESTTFFGICQLRLGDINSAKKSIRYVVSNIGAIKSDTRRIQYEKRLIRRIEDECILSQLIGKKIGKLDSDEIHLKSIEAVQKSEDEILEMIGDAIPGPTQQVLRDVTDYSIKLLPAADQKLLEGPKAKIPKKEMGKKALVALRRIGWRTFCDESSEVFKLWNKRIPKVFNQGYFALAVTTTLKDWKIGIPALGVGLAATAMKYTCHEFCDTFKPEGLMIPKNEKDNQSGDDNSE